MANLSHTLARLDLLKSQAGQDLWVIGECFNETRAGVFLDIGAYDGVTISNTYGLEVGYSWTGYCVEANPKLFAQLSKNRKCHCVNACIDHSKSKVRFAPGDALGGIVGEDTDNKLESSDDLFLETRSLMQLMDEINAPLTIDYLSIDIEGAEGRALSSFDFRRCVFNAITIERPSDKLNGLLKKNGYILVRSIPGLDSFFIHSSFLEDYRKNVFSFYRKLASRERDF